MDCQNQGFSHILSNWPFEQPKEGKISATFAGNHITTLQGLPPTDAILDIVLSHCQITYLNPGLFEACVNVRYVDLSHNLITGKWGATAHSRFHDFFSNFQPKNCHLISSKGRITPQCLNPSV